MEFDSEDEIRVAVAAGLGVSVLTRQALGIDPALAERIAVLDVQAFPIRDTWQVVHRHGKRLSVVAKSFMDFLRGAPAPSEGPAGPWSLATADVHAAIGG
jgi:DNA-binding transcriptional LysR family regulator